MPALKKISLFLLIIILGCVIITNRLNITENQFDEKIDEKFKSILLHPEKFDSLEVELTGIFTYEFENVAIYLSSKDADSLFSNNAIWINSEGLLDTTLDSANHKRIHIIGRFDIDDKGHLGLYAGTLNEVKVFELVY
ncbi:MAG: hypothetical protein HOP30_18330 [Cyclobacteriaceae bacterium]|nr:hypothetical protein [Cyclobacteriaceae bacterium]